MSADTGTHTPAIRWVPLESNPDIFNDWSRKMGLDTSRFAFHDIFGLDPELLAFVPQPVEAVLLLYPISEEVQAMAKAEDSGLQVSQVVESEGDPIWFKQTISNACGTIGLLHALSNTRAINAVQNDSPLFRLLEQARTLPPLSRAKLLESSKELQAAHSTTASTGQTVAPPATDNIDLHFICFIRDKNGELVELDGNRKGPIKRGVNVVTQDQLLTQAVKFIQQKYMSLNPDEVNFNLIALGPAGADS